MNRLPDHPLTERELELMHVFWQHGELSAHGAREKLERTGRELTYTTVANLCRGLWEKAYLERLGKSRPFTFRPSKTLKQAAGTLISDLATRLFGGSREQLLLHVIGPKKLTKRERELLEALLNDQWPDEEPN